MLVGILGHKNSCCNCVVTHITDFFLKGKVDEVFYSIVRNSFTQTIATIVTAAAHNDATTKVTRAEEHHQQLSRQKTHSTIHLLTAITSRRHLFGVLTLDVVVSALL